VPVRDPHSLATHMLRFIETPELAAQMGRRSRDMVVNRYSVNHVNALLMQLMGLDEDCRTEPSGQDRPRVLASSLASQS
ncbi:MAG TPA: hypothetical protein VF442_01450, partial [Sphingobium sp.]